MRTGLQVGAAILRGVMIGTGIYLAALLALLLISEVSGAAPLKTLSSYFQPAFKTIQVAKPKGIKAQAELPEALTLRDEMQIRAIRFVGISREANGVNHYSANGVYITTNLVLTNHHVCEVFKDAEYLGRYEPKLQSVSGELHEAKEVLVSDNKDLCLVVTDDLDLNLPRLEMREKDPDVNDTLIQAAYSYNNLLGKEFFMFQERRAQVIARETMNPNSFNIPPFNGYENQFLGPIYKLTAQIYYGDSGSPVYDIINGKLVLAAEINAGEISPKTFFSYAIPASTISNFIKASGL